MQKFSLGRTVATPAALGELDRLGVNPLLILGMHAQLERGALDADDHAANERAVQDGSRVFSAYIVGGTKFWCITEHDRSYTTILLPSEY
ncbi:MAG: hypothetical protein ABI702_22530 [Burkholderiales bacterium]